MGRTNLILDNLIAEGKVKPFIVVMETSAASVRVKFPLSHFGRAPLEKTRTAGFRRTPPEFFV